MELAPGAPGAAHRRELAEVPRGSRADASRNSTTMSPTDVRNANDARVRLRRLAVRAGRRAALTARVSPKSASAAHQEIHPACGAIAARGGVGTCATETNGIFATFRRLGTIIFSRDDAVDRRLGGDGLGGSHSCSATHTNGAARA